MIYIRNIIFFNVVVIILLHSFIPHQHIIEIPEEEDAIAHENADDLLDYFSLALHQSSANFLINYLPANQNSLKNFEQSKRELFLSADLTKEESIIFYESWYLFSLSQKLPKQNIILSNELRGPPTI